MARRLSIETPASLFGELVDEAAARQDERPSTESTTYLVQLLAGFVAPSELHRRTETDSEATVAEIFAAAMGIQGMRRFALLKLAGDLSLFISGVLPDSLDRRAVGFDYYQQIGGIAYGTAASDSHSPEVTELFRELCGKLRAFVIRLAVLHGADSGLRHLGERALRRVRDL